MAIMASNFLKLNLGLSLEFATGVVFEWIKI